MLSVFCDQKWSDLYGNVLYAAFVVESLPSTNCTADNHEGSLYERVVGKPLGIKERAYEC